jgi:hypothetical protein
VSPRTFGAKKSSHILPVAETCEKHSRAQKIPGRRETPLKMKTTTSFPLEQQEQSHST